MNSNLTDKQVDSAFKLLADKLASTELPKEDGSTYRALSSEFMLMHQESQGRTEWYAFKHRRTRNYLYVSTARELYIPKTNEPFALGFFGN